jgi:hypothetical protein
MSHPSLLKTGVLEKPGTETTPNPYPLPPVTLFMDTSQSNRGKGASAFFWDIPGDRRVRLEEILKCFLDYCPNSHIWAVDSGGAKATTMFLSLSLA